MVVEASASGQPGFRVLGPSDGPRIREAVVELIVNDSYRLAAQRLAGEIRLSASVGDSLALVAPWADHPTDGINPRGVARA